MMFSSGLEHRLRRREHRQPAARQPLAEAVVGVADERQRDAARHERAEALARRAVERDLDGVVGQTLRRRSAWSPRSPASCPRCGRRCGSASRTPPACATRAPAGCGRSARCRARLRARDPARAPCAAPPRPAGPAGAARGVRSMPLAFQWSTAGRTSRQSARPIMSSIFRKPSCAISSRTSSAMNRKKFSTNSGEPVNFLRSSGILRRDAHRAGVQVADAHHDAAHHDQRRRGEAVLLGAEQRADHHVAPGLHLAVHLHDDAVAQLVEHEHLLRFRQAQLPRQARVLQAGQAATRPCRRRGRRSARRRSAPWPRRPPRCPRRPRPRASPRCAPRGSSSSGRR